MIFYTRDIVNIPLFTSIIDRVKRWSDIYFKTPTLDMVDRLQMFIAI